MHQVAGEGWLWSPPQALCPIPAAQIATPAPSCSIFTPKFRARVSKGWDPWGWGGRTGAGAGGTLSIRRYVSRLWKDSSAFASVSAHVLPKMHARV